MLHVAPAPCASQTVGVSPEFPPRLACSPDARLQSSSMACTPKGLPQMKVGRLLRLEVPVVMLMKPPVSTLSPPCSVEGVVRSCCMLLRQLLRSLPLPNAS